MVDLRSDFLSRPSEAMIEAMNQAARSASAFGLREDPYVRRLETRVAAELGKQEALYCPTCTQANQIAIHLHCRPGDVVAAEADSHVFTSEAGAYAALSGTVAMRIPGQHGVMNSEALARALAPGDSLGVGVGLVVMENTHVRSGGCVVPVACMAVQRSIAADAGVPVHLDGARLPNAAIAQAMPLATLAACADSVSLSLNKGLGAPLGAVLAGASDFIGEAERVRQRLGGGWRPAGIPAAAAIVALDDWQSRITRDHRRARRLAQTLAELPGLVVDLEQVQSNLILAALDGMNAAELTDALAAHDVLVLAYLEFKVRLAIHANIDDGDVDRVAAAFRAVATGRGHR